MTYLPIDYYILLQKGYEDAENAKFVRSNKIMFNKMPIIQ